MLVDGCYLLNYNFSKHYKYTKTTSTVSNFGTSSPFLFLLITFFELPNNCIVSSVNSSSLYPVFILKTILFVI